MSVKSICAAAVLALAAVSGAQAATITFEGAPQDLFVFGSYVEDGFRYEVAEGGLYVNGNGNPGNDMEGYSAGGGGVLSITALDVPFFTFDALDFWSYAVSGTGSQTLTVTGWRDGDELATDSFLLASSSTFDWTLFGATNLDGLKLDRLNIALDAGPGYWEAVDNIRLTPVSAVPEPGVWALMITGFGLAGAALRRGRRSAAAA